MVKTPKEAVGCACCSRRRFLAGCGGLALAPLAGRDAVADRRDEKTRIRVVYALHAPVQPGPDWPNKGFDFRPVMERFNTELPQRCPGFEFLPALASGPDEAARILEQDASSPVDGYLVVQMNCWNRVVQTFVPTGKPVLYADFPYAGSGGFLVYTAGFLRQPTPTWASSRPRGSRTSPGRCGASRRRRGKGPGSTSRRPRRRCGSRPRRGPATSPAARTP